MTTRLIIENIYTFIRYNIINTLFFLLLCYWFIPIFFYFERNKKELDTPDLLIFILVARSQLYVDTQEVEGPNALQNEFPILITFFELESEFS